MFSNSVARDCMSAYSSSLSRGRTERRYRLRAGLKNYASFLIQTSLEGHSLRGNLDSGNTGVKVNLEGR